MFQKKIPTLFRTRLPPCPFGNFLVWGTVINLWLVQDYKDAKKRKKRTVFAADTVAILRNVTPFSSQISRADPDPKGSGSFGRIRSRNLFSMVRFQTLLVQMHRYRVTFNSKITVFTFSAQGYGFFFFIELAQPNNNTIY